MECWELDAQITESNQTQARRVAWSVLNEIAFAEYLSQDLEVALHDLAHLRAPGVRVAVGCNRDGLAKTVDWGHMKTCGDSVNLFEQLRIRDIHDRERNPRDVEGLRGGEAANLVFEVWQLEGGSEWLECIIIPYFVRNIEAVAGLTSSLNLL